MHGGRKATTRVSGRLRSARHGQPLAPTGETGVLGNQVSASTQVFSTPAEATTSTTHAVDLGAYAGATIYVVFRSNSNDKFLLVVDDVDVTDRVPISGRRPLRASAWATSRSPPTVYAAVSDVQRDSRDIQSGLTGHGQGSTFAGTASAGPPSRPIGRNRIPMCDFRYS